MQYAFLTRLIPEQLEECVDRCSKNNMQDAANALQWHIYNGLCKNLNSEIQIINLLPIGSFPQYYKKPFVSNTKFDTEYCKKNINIGFLNLKLIRKISQTNCVYNSLKRWYRQTKNPKTLFVYTASAVFVKALSKIKKIYPALNICIIVADLPDMSSLSSKKVWGQKILGKYLSAVSYAGLECIDSFVLLTKHMADYMQIDKPYCIMEGISTDTGRYKRDNCPAKLEKTIFYAGTLHRRFGVLNLLAAFQLIDNPEYRLIICGIGDSEKEIKSAAQNDPRIRYLGKVSRDEVLRIQQNVTVLVNPRQNIEEFTKYSFPSKNLEYLSAGIPVIAYKLDGIPDEYDEYFYYVETNDIAALKNKLVEVCEMDSALRAEKAEKSRRFVHENKNEVIQTKKIIAMLNEIGVI